MFVFPVLFFISLVLVFALVRKDVVIMRFGKHTPVVSCLNMCNLLQMLHKGSRYVQQMRV